jgi:hypothetical protein
MKKTVLREAILNLLGERRSGATICPSEAARVAHPQNWREHMEATRQAAIELVREGLIDIYQTGKPIGTDKMKGPIRLRLRHIDHHDKP